MPPEPQLYIHRTGRTAQAGKEGVAITLAAWEGESKLKAIATCYSDGKRQLPTPEEVAVRTSQRVTVVLEDKLRVKTNLEREWLGQFVPMVKALTKEGPELMAMPVDELNQARMCPYEQQEQK